MNQHTLQELSSEAKARLETLETVPLEARAAEYQRLYDWLLEELQHADGDRDARNVER